MLRFSLLLCAVLLANGCTGDKVKQSSEHSATLYQKNIDLHRASSELDYFSEGEQEILVGDRCRCAPGATGPQGPEGPQGPPGDGGSGSSSQTIHYSMSLPIVPNYAFAFYPANGGGLIPTKTLADGFTPVQFNPLSTNPSPPDYAYTFLVPEDGVISDIVMRVNFTALGTIAPVFTYTVYGSSASLDTSGPVTGWLSTGLFDSTDLVELGLGDSTTVTSRNTTEPSFVSAGTILTVVISSTGFNLAEIGPATFSVSFKYSEVLGQK